MPEGLSIGCATLIGNALGAGNIAEAQRVVRIGVALEAVYGLVNGLVFTVVLRSAWGRLFTDDATVLALTYSILPVMYFYGFWDATKVLNVIF